MASPNIKDVSLFGVEEEVTEGTYLAPQAATSYFNPEEDGVEFTPTREFLERNVLNASIGASTPKMGMKGVVGGFKQEFRASGTEGSAPNYGSFIKALLGATRAISSNVTTKNSGNTGSVLQIEDADISKFTVNDIILVKESGGHHVAVVTAKATGAGVATITIAPAKASGSFSNSVVISKSKMYYTAASGHPSLSLSYYWGNVKRDGAMGVRVKSMSLEGWQTGGMALLGFAWEGLTYSHIAGVAPHTPTLDTGTPPVILDAKLYKDGATTSLSLNNFGLNVENTISWMTDFSDEDGKVKSRVTERKITGSLNPYLDDTDVSWYTAFNAGTEFSLLLRAWNPSSTAGEATMGSVIAIWLPKCIVSTRKVQDLEGLLTEGLEFAAVRGSDGSTEEMYLAFI